MAVLWRAAQNWVVFPYQAVCSSLLDPLIYQPASDLCFVNVSSCEKILQLADKTLGPENSEVCETVPRSSQRICYSPFACKRGGRTSYSRWVDLFPSTCKCSDFLMLEGCFLATAVASWIAVNSSKFSRTFALDVL